MNALPVEIDAEKITFPWFNTDLNPEEIAAYSRFLCALCRFAENQKRITCKVTDYENEKFALRTFLLRLGFIGDEPELKKARKVLLSRLSGNSAYRKTRMSSTVPVSEVLPTEENTSQGKRERSLGTAERPSGAGRNQSHFEWRGYG